MGFVFTSVLNVYLYSNGQKGEGMTGRVPCPLLSAFVVQMSFATMAEMLDSYWTNGLNCKVHWV